MSTTIRKKTSIEECRDAAEKKGGRLISTSVKKASDRLEWECSCGYRWFASYGNIKHRGSWCPKCAMIDRKKTNLEKYGCENPSQSKEIREKKKNTSLARFGVESHFQSKEIRDKIEQANIEKYGFKSPLQSPDVQEKIRQSNFEKYGCEYPTQHSGVKEKIKQTNMERYGGVAPACNQKIQDKIIKTNLERYGCEVVLQNTEIKDRVKSTCLEKYGSVCFIQSESQKEKNKKKQREKNPKIFEDGTDLRDLISDMGGNVASFNKLFRMGFGKEDIVDWQESGRAGSSLETLILKNMNDGGIDAELFSHKINDNFKSYRPDIKINNSIYIDADGLYWHSDFVKKNKRSHFDRREAIEKAGIRLLQFREDEICNQPEIINSMINALIGRFCEKIGARKTQIRETSASEARTFFIKNHLMGHMPSAKAVGLYFQGELVACISYRKYKTGVDISRFCNKLNTSIPGGLSKLLKYIETKENPSFIQSFVDLRYGNGHSLEKLGFLKQSVTLGWKWTDLKNTFNRLYCRANMDDRQLSEKEYAAEMKLVRIYDAGQAKFMRYYKANSEV